MRFVKGPFDRLRGRGSFATVSELVELAVKLRDRDFCTVSELAELAVKLRDRVSVRSVSLPNWPLS